MLMFLQFENLKIIKDDNFAPTPIDCPVCEILFYGPEEHRVYKESGCCFDCYDNFAVHKKKEWEKGYRPSRLEIKNRVKVRSLIPSYNTRG
jgi:hypothetical protein